MSELAKALGAPRRRYSPVLGAYDGMTPANKETFKEVIKDTSYSHAHVASALQEIGYDVDRKQVQWFREQLRMGKVSL